MYALVLLWCSLLSEERSFDHQGLERGVMVFMGVWRPSIPLTLDVSHSNHSSRAAAVRNWGGGSINNALRASMVGTQSVLDQSRAGSGARRAGVAKDTKTGTWSDPVDSSVVSHLVRKGERELEAKARSRTAGLPIPLRGNLVYTPGVFNKAKPLWSAVGKKGSKVKYSLWETALVGSEQ